MNAAAVLTACYLIGAIPFGLFVGKLQGIDIRKHGSGNIGASNVLRLLGPGPAAVVMVGDTLKGFLPVLMCKAYFDNPWIVVLGGLLSILGHSVSIFLKLRGGKGVATSLGVVIGLDPLIGAIAFLLWVALVAIFRYISIASIIASASVSIMMWAHAQPSQYIAFAVVAAAFILIKHKSNIGRLRAGTEPKIGQKAEIQEKDE